jgi:hypothetical protein
MPPMAYIEEIIPDEPIQVPPAHLLFTVPENWNPPTCFPGEITQMATKNHQGSQRGESQLVDFPPCYIIEEIPTDLEAEPTAGAAEIPPTEVPGRNEPVEDEATGLEGEPIGVSLEEEGGIAPMPRPLSAMQEVGRVQLPLLHPDHLTLVFELRSMVEDLIHRTSLVSQRVDLLYDAYSDTQPGQRCPTCAQPFVLIAKADDKDGEGDMDYAETTG